MKTVAFLLLVAVATSYAEVRPCSLPNQYTISSGTQIVVSFSGHGIGYSTQSTSAVNFDKKKIGEIGAYYSQDGSVQEYQSIKDYEKGVEFQIDPKYKICMDAELEGPMEKRVGENASYAYSTYLGNHELTTDSFLDFLDIEGVVVGQMSQTVSQKDCIPISNGFSGYTGSGEDKTVILTVTGLFGYKDTIADPDKYFELPSYCSSRSSGKGNNSQMWKMLRYRDFRRRF